MYFWITCSTELTLSNMKAIMSWRTSANVVHQSQVTPVLSHGNCLKARTIQALLYHRAENLLYKTGCLHSPHVSCASVEPSEVYQTDNKIPHSVLLKAMDKKKQSKASYTFSRDHKFPYPHMNLLFGSFNFAVALRINFILRTGSSLCTKNLFSEVFTAWHGRCPP